MPPLLRLASYEMHFFFMNLSLPSEPREVFQ